MINRQDIVGGWTLREWSITGNGRVSHPFGESPIGILAYTQDGCMSAQLMSGDAMSLDGAPLRGLSAELNRALVERFFAYAGRYRIEDNTIIHEVMVSLNPDFVGREQRRHASLQGDILELTGHETDAAGRERIHRLLWKRMEGEKQ